MRQGYREVKEQTAHFFYNFEWNYKRIERKNISGNLPRKFTSTMLHRRNEIKRVL